MIQNRLIKCFLSGVAIFFLAACSSLDKASNNVIPLPKRIIELGTVVTEDLPEKFWGKALLNANKFTQQNKFEVVHWEINSENGGRASGTNSYYTLFNHGGPHVDAPNHVDVGGGLDSLSIDSFIGPLKVFDVSDFSSGHSIPASFFKGKIEPGDIVVIYTKYRSPQGDSEFPKVITVTREASEFLARLPVRAFGTDSLSVYGMGDTKSEYLEDETAKAVPVHHSFLSRGIPVYEQLFNLGSLLNEKKMLFIGVPLNIKNGDGMLVRPVVFVY